MAQSRDGVFTWYHTDPLHSATVITDVDGNEVRRLAYKAFGEEVQNTGPGDAPPYTYTGKELDDTGLYYYGARYYDPVLCRFLTPDTVYDGNTPQGLNHYSYALNNPIIYRDPTGQLSYAKADPNDEYTWFKEAGERYSRRTEAKLREIAPLIGENLIHHTPAEYHKLYQAGALKLIADEYNTRTGPKGFFIDDIYQDCNYTGIIS